MLPLLNGLAELLVHRVTQRSGWIASGDRMEDFARNSEITVVSEVWLLNANSASGSQ